MISPTIQPLPPSRAGVAVAATVGPGVMTAGGAAVEIGEGEGVGVAVGAAVCGPEVGASVSAGDAVGGLVWPGLRGGFGVAGAPAIETSATKGAAVRPTRKATSRMRVIRKINAG